MRKSSNNHHRVWKKHYGEIPKDSDGRTYEIHHIDGNHNNNDISNLQCVTIHEHLAIHERQHDWGAVQAILMRLDITEEIRNQLQDAASKHQRELLKNGKHNWQKLSKEERAEIARRSGLQTLANRIGIHRINADPILAKENARKGGASAAKKCAGFLDTTAEHHGSKHVKGTNWWHDDNGNRIRTSNPPDKKWKRGMK